MTLVSESRLITTISCLSYFYGRGGLPHDEAKAVNYWLIGSNAGDADAAYNLACRYVEGTGY